MKKVLKKTIASVVAGVTLAVGMTAMSSSAYSTRKNIYDSAGKAIGNGYSYLSSSSLLVSTTAGSPRSSSVVWVDYVVGNHDTSRDESWLSDNGLTCNIKWYGSNFTTVRSIHEVDGYQISIVMN